MNLVACLMTSSCEESTSPMADNLCPALSIFTTVLLKCLKGQGLPARELHTVFCALIVSRIVYALSAWGDFLTADQTGKIDAYLCKALR